MSRPTAIMISLMLLAATAAAQDKPTIQRLNDAWVGAFNKGDSPVLAELYTEDAYLLPAGAEMIQGRQAIQAFWNQVMKRFGDGKLTTLDVQPLGPDAAREIGTFSFKTKGNTPEEVDGKYVVVWRKVNDQWKLATDILNISK